MPPPQSPARPVAFNSRRGINHGRRVVLTFASERGAGLKQFEHELLELLPRLRRFARSLTRDSTEADDLCQAAVEKALKRRHQRRKEARLDAWMFMIMRNCWIDTQRSRRREADRFVSGDAAEARAMATPPSDPLAAAALHQAMGALPPEQREAAALVWVEGFSYAEAAQCLKIPLGTLTSRLARARGKLIKTLEAA
jgi:RNA polymerase sigma factor (sigma-70 family)